jgi:hypothetical protein
MKALAIERPHKFGTETAIETFGRGTGLKVQIRPQPGALAST